MSDDPLHNLLEGYWYLATIAALGLAGILIVLALLVAWRRHVMRRSELERPRHRASAEGPIDVWQTGGRRLSSMVAPPPPTLPDDDDSTVTGPLDDPVDDDDDDDDDDREWWQRGGGE